MTEEKKYNIICGLPRSGSTLLANILNQNPRFYASKTSGLPSLLSNIKTGYEEILEHRISPDFDKKRNVLKSVVEGYYKDIDKEVIFDRNRVWSHEAFLAKEVFGDDVKFLVCVRDLTEILASFEKLYRKQDGYFDLLDKRNHPEKFSTLSGRLELWSSANGPVGRVFNSLKEMVYKTENAYIIPFEELTKYPENVMKNIYNFLEEDYYEQHDFNNVESVSEENDLMHGILDLHKTRKKVEPLKHVAKDVLGQQLFVKYAGQEFWK